MESERQKAIQAADFLKSRTTGLPTVGYLAGTGLSETIDAVECGPSIPYADIPHFPVSTVESHKGALCFGSIEGNQVMMMQGRFHLYEGYSPSQVCFPVRVMQEMGIKKLIISNAAGGINLNFKAGDIMIIQDHINLTGKNPLTGPNEDAWGIRFPDMISAYDSKLRNLAFEVAAKNQTPLQSGVYAGLPGPSLETPAETRYLKTIGSDAVGFSTIMEVIAGVHANMKILGLSLITNINNPDHPEPTTLESVLETAADASENFSLLVSGLIARMI